MKIVVELDDKKYEYIKLLNDGVTDYQTTLVLYKAIKNGKILPKSYGRLIDVDAFCEKAEADRKHSCYLQSWTADDVMLRLKTDYAPTILEADKGEKK